MSSLNQYILGAWSSTGGTLALDAVSVSESLHDIAAPLMIVNTTQGLISVDQNLLNLFRMSNASRSQVLFKLRFPHAIPNFFVESLTIFSRNFF